VENQHFARRRFQETLQHRGPRARLLQLAVPQVVYGGALAHGIFWLDQVVSGAVQRDLTRFYCDPANAQQLPFFDIK
jgi:hypothetical protein